MSDPTRTRKRRDPWIGLSIALLTLATHAYLFRAVSLPRGQGRDYIYMYLSTRAALDGQSPYRTDALFSEYLRTFPDRHIPLEGDEPYPGGILSLESIRPICFFYPPQSFFVLGPFSKLDWEESLIGWVIALTIATIAAAFCVVHLGAGRSHSRTMTAIILAVLLLNPLTQLSLSLGQTGLLVVAFVLASLWCVRRERPLLASVPMALAAIKPHFLPPFLVMLLLVGGSRPVLFTLVLSAILNVLGGLATTGNPGLIAEYLASTSRNYLNLHHNGPESEFIVGWNRLAWVLGGVSVELGATRILAGYLIWGALFALRWRNKGPNSPTPEHLLAISTTIALFCTSSHGYDLVMLALVVPYALRCFRNSSHLDCVVVAVLAMVAMIPHQVVVKLIHVLRPGVLAHDLLLSYRAIVLAVLVGFFLVRGEPALAARRSGGDPGRGEDGLDRL